MISNKRNIDKIIFQTSQPTFMHSLCLIFCQGYGLFFLSQLFKQHVKRSHDHITSLICLKDNQDLNTSADSWLWESHNDILHSQHNESSQGMLLLLKFVGPFARVHRRVARIMRFTVTLPIWRAYWYPRWVFSKFILTL